MRKLQFTDLSVIILGLLLSHVGGATEILVASKAEAQAALDAAGPGDRIVLANGEYGNFQITITSNGTAENPIIFAAQSGGECTLRGASGIRIRGEHVVVDGFTFLRVGHMGIDNNVIAFEGARYARLINCAFYRCGYTKYVHIILMSGGTQNSEVAHCYLEDIVGQGIGVQGTSNNVDNHIHHNHINRTTSDGESNGQEPIQIGQNQRVQGRNENRTVVEYNLIENMDGDCDPELISNKTEGNTYRYNTFTGNRPGTNLTIRGGENCLIEANYFDGSGIRVYGSGHVVRDNYIRDVQEGILLPGGTGTGIQSNYAETYDCTVEDNWISGTSEKGIRIGGGNPGGLYIHDILIKGNAVTADHGWMFYQARADFSAINWVGNIGFGEARLSNSHVSSGAETGDPGPIPELKPLAPSDVGPDWMHPAEWSGYPIHEGGSSVDTQDFLGWIDITAKPWIYVYRMDDWLYCREADLTESGGYVYFPN